LDIKIPPERLSFGARGNLLMVVAEAIAVSVSAGDVVHKEIPL
jgi:hypothetical protein